MKKTALYTLLLFAALNYCASAYGASWLSGYTHRIKITIDHTKVDSTLSNFPVAVMLTSSNFDFSKANSDGYDIRFTSDDGTTLLKYERERHDSTNQKAEYWVKIPSISSSVDTDFYIYYRTTDTANGADPTNVWDSYYRGVWHMQRDPSGTAPQETDSTSYNDDGTSAGSMTSGDLVNAVIGKGLQLDGVNDQINLASSSNLTMGTEDFSWSGWFYLDDWNAYHDQNSIFTRGGTSDTADGFRTAIYSTDGHIWTTISDGTRRTILTSDAGEIALNTQYFIAVTYDRSGNCVIYKNGVAIKSGSITASNGSITTDRASQIGGYTTQRPFQGIMDEVRVSKGIARSAAWIKASYNSGNDSLVSYGSEEVQGESFQAIIIE